MITVDLLEVRVHSEASGTLEIIDDPARQRSRLAMFNLKDGALHQSVTSTTNHVKVRCCSLQESTDIVRSIMLPKEDLNRKKFIRDRNEIWIFVVNALNRSAKNISLPEGKTS